MQFRFVSRFTFVATSVGTLAALSAGRAQAIFPVDDPIPYTQTALNQGQSLSLGSPGILATGFALKVPKPGQAVVRPTEKPNTQEMVYAVGAVPVMDSLSHTPLLFSGELALDLSEEFGADSLNELGRKAFYSSQNRKSFGQRVERILMQFIAQHARELRVKPENLKFNVDKFYADESLVLASFDLSFQGAKLQGGEVTFRFSEGRLVQLLTRTFGARQDMLKDVRFDDKIVQETIHAVLGPEAKLVAGSTRPLIVPRIETIGGRERYAFHPAVAVEAKSASGETFAVVRSLDSQEILEWYSLHLSIGGRVEGAVNTRVVGGNKSREGMPFVTVKAGSTKTYADEEGRFEASAGEATAHLESKAFKVMDKSSGWWGKVASAKGKEEIVFDAEENSSLAETTTYYHLNVIQSWAKEIIRPDWFDKQVTANVNIDDTCNAYWDGTLNFFKAGKKSARGRTMECNNTGEIADVVYHEWGHGLDAHTGGIDDRAFSEGIGDIVSMLLTDSPEVGPTFLKSGEPVRNLDGDYQYPPKAEERESHREGLIIGSTWFHMVRDLEEKYGNLTGRETATRLFLKSLYTASQYTDQYQAILALDAQGGDPKEGPNYCLINKAFARHGLAKVDKERCQVNEPAFH